MKTKEVADLKEFVSLMQQEPVLTEYISSDLAEVEGITAKKLRKKATIQFKAAHLVWENFHANGVLSSDCLAQTKAAIDMARDEISKRQAELKDAEMQLTAQAINKKLARAYDYEQVVVPVIENLVPRMVVKYSRLSKAFNRSIELIEEGGAVAVIGESELKSFLLDYESFHQEVVMLKLIIAEHKNGVYRELRSSKLVKLCKEFELLAQNATKLIKHLNNKATNYQDIDFLMEDLYGASVPSSIFNLLIETEKAEIFIDDSFNTEFVKQNILDRVRLCWKSRTDVFFNEGVIEGAKYDAVLGIKKSSLEGVDLAFDENVYFALCEKVKKVDLTTSLEIIEMASRAKVAGNVYKSIPTLTFEEGRKEPWVNSTFGVRSIVSKLAPNLLLKVDKVGDVPGMGWIGNSTAEYMNYVLLMSAGGGRVFMNKAALVAFAAISNSLVDVKAYIASVAGSSCVEEKSVLSAIGTVIWVYLDANGKPIVKNGRIRGKRNSNEGSSWNNWAGKFAFQERTVAEEWCSYLEEVNQVQAEFSIKFRDHMMMVKDGISIHSFIKSMWLDADVNWANYGTKGLNAVTKILFTGMESKKDACGGQSFSAKNLKINRGQKTGALSIRLPYIVSKEVTAEIVKRFPMFSLDSSSEDWIAISVVNSRRAITTAMGLINLADRIQSKQTNFDWMDYLEGTFGNELLRDYVSQFSCNWDWKKEGVHCGTIDGAFVEQIDGFATLKTKSGQTIVDVRREMESKVDWPVFKGLESLWGFEPEVSQKIIEEIEFVVSSKLLSKEEWAETKPELLSKFSKLVAKRLEQAVEIDGFDPSVWSNGLATGIIGKGKSLPIDLHKLFTPWNENITAGDLRGKVSSEQMAEWLKVSFVKNKYDGACKSKAYKGFLQEVGEDLIESKFELDDEKSADPNQRMVPVGYMFGEPMRVRVAIMRRMKLGKVGATFQATEKKPTSLYGSGLAGEATSESTLAYKEYMGIVPCGGTMSRTKLPQIPAKRRIEFLDTLNVDYTECIANKDELLPLQEFISQTDSKSKKAVLVSMDGYIIDGHHRWYAATDEPIDIILVDMNKDELLEKALAFEGTYYSKPARFELISEFFSTVAKLPMADGNGKSLTSFQTVMNPYSIMLPGEIYLNLMEALCRIESSGLFQRVQENIENSLDGELLGVLKEMGCVLNDSAKLSNKLIDSINAKLSDFVRGAVIKAVNIPVHVFDGIQQGEVILPPSMRVKTYDGKNLALAFRYPIASATSVGVVKVFFGDDPAVKPMLEAYGVDFTNYPEVVFMSSGDKTNFQFDDDGDCFGVLCEPKFAIKDWSLNIARAENEFLGKFSKKAIREDGTINERKYSKSLWGTVKSWVAIGMNLLERRDYDRQNIEMGDIKTENNKKSMEIVDLRGYCTVEFRKWSHRDGRGPVGLISDLFSVILASDASGEEFTRLACIAGYILQHSIDSAKKEKLVIPPAILLRREVWAFVNGKLELRPEVNKIVMEWNEAWASMDEALIESIERKANSLYVIDSEGNVSNRDDSSKVPVTSVLWLPTLKMIINNTKVDDRVLFFAPSALLANMSSYAKLGKYGTFDMFGNIVPVHPKLIDAADPTRYISAHTLEIHQFTDDDGKVVPWKAMSAFRKINVKEYVNCKAVSKMESIDKSTGRKVFSEWVEFTQRPNSENFPRYFQDEFKSNIWISYPNIVFKHVLRWSVEMAFGGKDSLSEFAAKFNESNQIEKESFVAPVFPWSIAKSSVLSPSEETTVVQMIGTDYSFINDNQKLNKDLLNFFQRNVLYYKSESKQKYSKELWSLMASWVESPMSISEVTSHENFNKKDFYLKYTQVMRQVGLLLLGQSQYSECTQETLNYIQSLSKSSSEYSLLTKYKKGGNNGSSEVYYSYTPNQITARIASLMNGRYQAEITKNGRNPEDCWTPSFWNSTKWSGFSGTVLNNYQVKPNWYIGDSKEWSEEMKANVTDLVAGSLTRHVTTYTCPLTEPLLEELEQIENVHKYIKEEKSGSNPFTSSLLKHNRHHFVLTQESYMDCECCQKHIRKFITGKAREDRFEQGSREWLNWTAKQANVHIAKELIQAIKAQCKVLVTEAIEKDCFDFVDNPYGLSTDTIKEYVEAFSCDMVKAKFGLPLESDFETFKSWDSHWGSLPSYHKAVFIELMKKELKVSWWQAPMGYLLNNLESYKQSKKLLTVKEEETPTPWMTLEEWLKADEPTPPPSGGGVGKSSGPSSIQASLKFHLWTEAGCRNGDTPASKIVEVSQEINRLKDIGKWEKTSIQTATLVIFWASSACSSDLVKAVSAAKANGKKVCVLNTKEQLHKLLTWSRSIK